MKFHRFRNKDECWKAFVKYSEIFEGFLPDGTLAPVDMWPVRRALRGEVGIDSELHVRRKDTGEQWIASYNFGPIRDKDGAIEGSVVVARDITDQKRAEEALRTSERRYSALFANKINGMAHCRIITDDDGKPVDYRIMQINEAYERIIGIKKPDIEGRRATEVFPDIKHYAFDYIRVYGKVALEGGEIKFEEFFEATGQYLSIYAYSPLPGEFAAIFTDVTERKRMEEALQKAHESLELRVEERTVQLSQAYENLQREMSERERLEEQLRQSQKMEAIGSLAGGIAHDFNNILAAILGFTEMAADDVADRPEVARNLQKVLKSAMRARELVKQILAFSRKTKYERIPLALTPLINETVQLLRASIPATIEIRLAVTASSDHILAAAVEVQQILMNLATNASLAMQDKGGALEISLTDIDFKPDSPVMEPDVMPGEYLQLMVKDTGVGMSPEVMKRVFEPFFTTREVGKGSGMGLAVVYGIVNDLQGTIIVESAPGSGSTFRVLFPKIKTAIEKEHLPTVETPRGTERILFVDDEQMLLEWGQAILERLGYSVVALTDSTEALRTFSSDPSRFDLVITDQTMSGMTGMQLAKELLTIRHDIPIILCTGHSEAVSLETAKDAGIRQFLMKPVAKQESAQAIRRVLDTNAEG